MPLRLFSQRDMPLIIILFCRLWQLFPVFSVHLSFLLVYMVDNLYQTNNLKTNGIKLSSKITVVGFVLVPSGHNGDGTRKAGVYQSA